MPRRITAVRLSVSAEPLPTLLCYCRAAPECRIQSRLGGGNPITDPRPSRAPAFRRDLRRRIEADRPLRVRRVEVAHVIDPGPWDSIEDVEREVSMRIDHRYLSLS